MIAKELTNDKKDVVSNILCTFAPFSPRTRFMKEINVHIFMLVCKRIYHKDIRLSNPIGCSLSLTASVLGGTGGDSLSYFKQLKFRSMPRTDEIRVKANNSSHDFAPISAKTVSDNISIKCDIYDLTQLLQTLSTRKHITLNVYVQTIGNIINSEVSGVNVLSNL